MRLSNLLVIYFVMGIVLFGSGVIPWNDVELADTVVDVEGENVEENEDTVTGEGGWLENPFGPIQTAVDTVSGGALLTLQNFINTVLGVWAWPVTLTNSMGAPRIIVLLSSTLSFAFTIGVLAVFKGTL